MQAPLTAIDHQRLDWKEDTSHIIHYVHIALKDTEDIQISLNYACKEIRTLGLVTNLGMCANLTKRSAERI